MTAVAAAAAGYLLGSVPVAFIVARMARRVDIRTVGSGNVGATNVWRTIGPRAALATLVLDVTKGAAAVWLARHLGGGEPAEAAAGLAAIVGHAYPVWLRFAGGKGVATALGACLAWSPAVAGVAVAAFAAVVGVTRIVSAGSLSASGVAVLAAFGLGIAAPVAWALMAAAGLIVWRHAGNLRRMIDGTEPRITRGPRA